MPESRTREDTKQYMDIYFASPTLASSVMTSGRGTNYIGLCPWPWWPAQGLTPVPSAGWLDAELENLAGESLGFGKVPIADFIKAGWFGFLVPSALIMSSNTLLPEGACIACCSAALHSSCCVQGRLVEEEFEWSSGGLFAFRFRALVLEPLIKPLSM